MPLHLRVVTPTAVTFDGEIQSMSASDYCGEFEILPQHAPMVTVTVAGPLSYRDHSGMHRMMVRGGFVEVLNDSITALVDGVEEKEM